MVRPFSKRSTAVQDRNALFTSIWNIILPKIIHFKIKILSKYSYCVQKASIDEGYIEVTGIIKGSTIEELKKNSIIYAKTLQNDVKNTLGFTINIRYKQF